MFAIVISIIAALGLGGCAPTPSAPVAAPRLVFDEARFDAGSVDQGARIEHRFIVRNGGGSPLQISGVRASCDCAATIAGRTTIPAREAGAIEVAIPTDDLAGDVVRTFTVFSNDPANPSARLEVHANVDPRVIVVPRELYLGAVAPGERSRRSLGIEFPGNGQARVVKTKARGTVVVPQLGSRNRIEVSIDPAADPGVFRELVAVRTTHPERPVVEIVVAGVVVDPSPDPAKR